jgi:hypothetical protein
MRNMVALLILIGAMSIPVWALPPSAPEINGASATSAVGLIGGALLLIRSRKKK